MFPIGRKKGDFIVFTLSDARRHGSAPHNHSSRTAQKRIIGFVMAIKIYIKPIRKPDIKS